MAERYRVVLDTNILLRGLVNLRSNSGSVVDACDRRAVVLLLSKPVLNEYRFVLTSPEVTQRYPELTEERIEVALRRLTYVGDVFRSLRRRFPYPRDPGDEKFIELAIAGEATHIITGDRDLLVLSSGRGGVAKRLRQQAPSLKITTAADFLAVVGV